LDESEVGRTIGPDDGTGAGFEEGMHKDIPTVGDSITDELARVGKDKQQLVWRIWGNVDVAKVNVGCGYHFRWRQRQNMRNIEVHEHQFSLIGLAREFAGIEFLSNYFRPENESVTC
jgi:hypothetical protein